MAAKIALVFVSAFVIFQIFSSQTQATIIRRDAPAPATEKNNGVEETINAIKQGIEDVIQKAKDNDLVKNITQMAEEWTQKVQEKINEQTAKIKAAASEASAKN